MKHVVSNSSLRMVDSNNFGTSFVLGSINKINKMYALLEQSNERPPSAEEIAKELDMTVNDVKRV
jgi:DNA-directed RNA polymerase sigma subunit (sigma70/sigma32)